MVNPQFGALYAVDDLNRYLPDERDVGKLRPERYVGCFYFPLHGSGKRPTGEPLNLTETARTHPEAFRDYDDPIWGRGWLYWGEPLFGYYFTDDRWVLRRHVKMLTMAGVDFLIFDTTNRLTFRNEVGCLLEVLEEYRKAGWPVPKIVYYTNTKSGETVQEIWKDLYKPGLYRKLWFQWEGKPLIIADPAECTKEQRDFFTFRLPQWPTEEKKQDGFPWIDFERPQRVWKNKAGENEIVPVSVAQHPNLSFGDGAFYGDPRPRGRAWHGCGNDKTEEAVEYGYNVAEQWDRAIELDPKIVFFTGWNEWIVGHIRGEEDRPLLFVDQADQEYSRDAEPMRGGHFDSYYMQMCQYIRRYKGAPPVPKPAAKRTIDVDGGFEQWKAVPAYDVMPFGTIPREAEGHGGVIYRDSTGRNEFECVKTAHDDRYVMFYARTREKMNFNMFTQWMNLYIGVVGQHRLPNWHGYRYAANLVMLDGNTTFLQTSLGGYRFGKNTRARIKTSDREVMIRVPRSYLGIEKGGFELFFKWADHTGAGETISDFYLHGDAAPYGRFAFLYSGK